VRQQESEDLFCIYHALCDIYWSNYGVLLIHADWR